MAMPFETNHLAFLGLNFVFSGVGTIKNFTLYKTELLENANKAMHKVFRSLHIICI